MSYLEKMKEHRKTRVAVWHKLRTSMSTGKFDFFVAFEGEEDEEFYSKFLTERFPTKKYRPLICDGKDGVLLLHKELVKAYGNPENVFFFLDSDHDRFLGKDNYPSQTFSTCGYSVENYIYHCDVVLSGIKKHFQLNPSDDLCDEIRDAYRKDSIIFEARSKPVMAYAVALRANGQNPKLDNVSLNEIFALNEFGLKPRKQVCVSLLASAEVVPLDIGVVLQFARQSRNTHPNIYFRGKLVAQFVLNFCRKLEKRFAGKSKLNGKQMRAKIEFSKRNFVSVFVDFVDAPQRLSDFFDDIDLVISGV